LALRFLLVALGLAAAPVFLQVPSRLRLIHFFAVTTDFLSCCDSDFCR
jgi:hypothetical protein